MRRTVKPPTNGKPTEQVMHLILVLCILAMAYTFFAKTELEQAPVESLAPAEVDGVGL